ncbi:ATP-binding protein [Streptomyces sp. NPDC052396]|uniref:ATP-binding protein n=1 Tax=Streptomyces sp. NPDC052396 TaxID=3365689 RepID=UPI0037D31746
MSLPLTRRIARAALLVAAGAAPLVGAAGAANAADLAQAPDLGGLTAVDGTHLGNTVEGASQQAGAMTTDVAGKAAHTAVPATGQAVGTVGKTARTTQRTTGELAGSAGSAVGGAAQGVTKGGGLTGGGAGVTDQLPHTLPSLG